MLEQMRFGIFAQEKYFRLFYQMENAPCLNKCETLAAVYPRRKKYLRHFYQMENAPCLNKCETLAAVYPRRKNIFDIFTRWRTHHA